MMTTRGRDLTGPQLEDAGGHGRATKPNREYRL